MKVISDRVAWMAGLKVEAVGLVHSPTRSIAKKRSMGAASRLSESCPLWGVQLERGEDSGDQLHNHNAQMTVNWCVHDMGPS